MKFASQFKLLIFLGFFSLHSALSAADFDLEETKKRYISGEYKAVAERAAEVIASREPGEDWRWLLGKSLWQQGKYPEASVAMAKALERYAYSIRLRVLAWDIYRSNGEAEKAAAVMDEINELGGYRRWNYRDPESLVALGEAAVILGADPRQVLDSFYEPVKKADPKFRQVYIAIGQLALDKHDYALAAKTFQGALKVFPDDPDMNFGLAEAFAPSDRKQMLALLEKVLEKNENHLGARILAAEHLVDAEEYEEADTQYEKALKVNPHFPAAWAYKAVLAHLKPDPAAETEARAKALQFWKTNPLVDHLIGRKLSQKYRFAEGSEYQRRAMQFDPSFLSAKIQLASDLLRLGKEGEGWDLAEIVHKQDPYDVAAYNLVTLKDTLAKFHARTNENFFLRMSPHESEVYGERVMSLLERSRAALTQKYDAQISERVTVEVFPEQKDFAVRTFGMPGGEGYLGVCFGHVITANSPASSSIPTMNWESMLWHEYCHVVTLQLTKNKMPRWLSEGISVYEERRADPTWGERLNPKYREMILEGEMKPIAEMSSAFMAPPSGLHLQFAYYQSSLVVEYLVQKHGIESLKKILLDLGEGKNINDSIIAHTSSMKELEKGFKDYAESVAKEMGPDENWEKPEMTDRREVDTDWLKKRPDNFYSLQERAAKALDADDLPAAITLLKRMIELYPKELGEDSAYAVLASVYRKQKNLEEERAILKRWAGRDNEARDCLLRLIEIESEAANWGEAAKYAERLLAINPMLSPPYRAFAKAHHTSENWKAAAAAYRTLLLLDPADPADVHFGLAQSLIQTGDKEAKKHLLLALEEAPRFRAAHKALLNLPEKTP